MESHPQNPEFRINAENFHPCSTSLYQCSVCRTLFSKISSSFEKILYSDQLASDEASLSASTLFLIHILNP